MKRRDPLEEAIIAAYERGQLKSIGLSKAQLEKQLERYRGAARATVIKDRRINIRLSSPDLMDLQARALEEGVPYQTLIASVLHKYVSGRLVAKPARTASHPRGTPRKRVAP